MFLSVWQKGLVREWCSPFSISLVQEKANADVLPWIRVHWYVYWLLVYFAPVWSIHCISATSLLDAAKFPFVAQQVSEPLRFDMTSRPALDKLFCSCSDFSGDTVLKFCCNLLLHFRFSWEQTPWYGLFFQYSILCSLSVTYFYCCEYSSRIST